MGQTVGNLLGFTTVGDLTAIQKMIDHVNDSVETDFAEVQRLAGIVRQSRAKLDDAMTAYQTRLKPHCKEYTAQYQNFDLFTREGARGKGVANDCLQAQGQMRTLAFLRKPVRGCTDACNYVPNYREWVLDPTTITCDASPCHNTLLCSKQLESLFTMQESARRAEEVLTACSTQGFDMFVKPPDETALKEGGPTLEEASQCAHGGAHGAQKSSMPPADLLVLALGSLSPHLLKEARDGVHKMALRPHGCQAGKDFF